MKATRQQLQERADQYAKDAGILHIALNDVLNRKVEWFRKGPHKLGIARPCGAEGGIVIHTFRHKGQSDYSCAYYWEEWFNDSFKHTIASNDPEAVALRQCAFAANEYIMREQNKDSRAAA